MGQLNGTFMRLCGAYRLITFVPLLSPGRGRSTVAISKPGAFVDRVGHIGCQTAINICRMAVSQAVNDTGGQ